MAVSRDTVGAVTLAVLAVLGLGLVAATLTTTYTTELGPGGPSGQEGDGVTAGAGSPGELQNETSNATYTGTERSDPVELPNVCIPILTEPGVIIGIIAAFALIVAVSYRQFELLGAAFTIYLVGLPLTLSYALATQCAQSGGAPGSTPVREMASQLGSTGQLTSTPVPPVLVAALFVLAALGAVVMVLTASGDETVAPPEELLGEEELHLSEFAAAAGTAADRIAASQATVDNAVYEAWQEMTELLAVGRPESTTAGEFAAAAIEAGLAAEDVAELTRLFEEVRYGEMDPEPREALAVETLRTIEATYSGDLPEETDDE